MNQLHFHNKTNNDLHITIEPLGEAFLLKQGDCLKIETKKKT